MQREYIVTAVVGLLGLATGAAAGYRWAEMKLEDRYAEQASKDVADAKEYYATVYKKDEYETAESAAQALLPASTLAQLAAYNGQALVPQEIVEGETPEPQPYIDYTGGLEKHNVFEDRGTEAALDPERRVPGKPYVIPEKAYLEGELDYAQESLTYYRKDDILADDRDQPVEDSDDKVGDDNLVQFGVGAPHNMVFIRNDELETDYEIVLSEGSFSEEVAGFTFKEDATPRRRMRPGDDE